MQETPRQQFRYLGCVDGEMIWESVHPLSDTNQHEVVICDWEWFWRLQQEN